jgi:hypothetical protein
MASSHMRADSPPAPDESPDEDGKAEDAEIPLTMTASVVLTSLPKDARSALRDAGKLGDEGRKGMLVTFYPVFIMVIIFCT